MSFPAPKSSWSGGPRREGARAQGRRRHGHLLCEGGTLAGALYGEIDALILKRHPILIGAGLPLVVGDFSPRLFDLTEQFALEGGATISTYEAPRRRPE